MVAPRSTTGTVCGATGIITCAPAVEAANSAMTAARENILVVVVILLASGPTARACVGRVGFGSRGVHRLDQLRALPRDLRAERGVFLEREVAAAVHPG